MKLKFLFLFLSYSLSIHSQNNLLYADSSKDSLFFEQKKALLTATWHKPFSYSSIQSNHAPLGPYMGNGDVGVVAFTSDNSQTLKISKVEFCYGWLDRLGRQWSGCFAHWRGEYHCKLSGIFRLCHSQPGGPFRI